MAQQSEDTIPLAAGAKKTFARRKKGSRVKEEATPTTTVASISPASSRDADDVQEAEETFGWLGLGLSKRRSSMVFPQNLFGSVPGLTYLFRPKQRWTKKELQKLAEYKSFLDEMSAYFAEIDAFQLVEESPMPKKDKTKPARMLQHATKQDSDTAAIDQLRLGKDLPGGTLQHQPAAPAPASSACTPPPHHMQSLRSTPPCTEATTAPGPEEACKTPQPASVSRSLQSLTPPEDTTSSLASTTPCSPASGSKQLQQHEEEDEEQEVMEDEDEGPRCSTTLQRAPDARASLGGRHRGTSQEHENAGLGGARRSSAMPANPAGPRGRSSSMAAPALRPELDARRRSVLVPRASAAGVPAATSGADIPGPGSRRTTLVAPVQSSTSAADTSSSGTSTAQHHQVPGPTRNSLVAPDLNDLPALPRRSSARVSSRLSGPALGPQPAARRSSAAAASNPARSSRTSIQGPPADPATSTEVAESSVTGVLPSIEEGSKQQLTSTTTDSEDEGDETVVAVCPRLSDHRYPVDSCLIGSEGRPRTQECMADSLSGTVELEDGLGRIPEQEDEDEESESGASEQEAAAVATSQAPVLTPMQELLQICSQNVDEEDIPTMDELIGEQADLKKVVKIGEGTYGEAFKYQKVVFKVVPVEGDQLVNGAAQKKAHEMAAEALIALSLSSLRAASDPAGNPQANVTSGFVETYQAGVCRGPYSKDLIKAWRKWDKQHGSENDPVEELAADQHYLVISMGDCGRDLEKYNIATFEEARSVLLQVAFTLAVAEEACEFEHRDLHWGNILVRPAASNLVPFRLKGTDIVVQSHGIAAALIDFTASRLRTLTGQVAYCDLSLDPELFEGPRGHVQFDSYRAMRTLTGDNWASSCLQTNCLWVAYLAEIMAVEKSAKMTAAHKRRLRDFRRRAADCTSCGELVFDELFKGLWVAKQ